MSNESLRSIVSQTKDIVAALVESCGEMTPAIEAALMNVEAKTPAKIDACAEVMARMENEAAYWKEKAAFYSKVSAACENVREKLKENIKYAMREMGVNELAGHDVRFRLSLSKPKVILDETALDPAYFNERVVRTPDKKRIEEDLKAGIPVDGAILHEVYSIRQYANSKGGERE